MTEIINLAEHGRRLLLRRFAHGAAIFTLLPIALSAHAGVAEPIVTIENFTFSPTPLTIPRGTTVTWVNDDDMPHSIYCQALNLRSQPLDTQGSFSHHFDRPGTFSYICGMHPFMHGTIIVEG